MEEKSDPKDKWPKFLNLTAEAKIETMRLAFVLAIALGRSFWSGTRHDRKGIFDAAAGLVSLGFEADTLKNAMTDK